MRHQRWLLALCLGMALALPCVALADDDDDDEHTPAVDLVWYTIGGGGGVSSLDKIVIAGTVGQFEAGEPCTESTSTIMLCGGFWSPDPFESSDEDDDNVAALTSPDKSAAGSMEVMDLPRELSLLPVSPNPCRGAAQVSWTVPKESRLSLTVHDVQGRRVAVIANGSYPAGRYHVRWDLRQDGVSAGLYFVRLQSQDGVRVRRLILVN